MREVSDSNRWLGWLLGAALLAGAAACSDGSGAGGDDSDGGEDAGGDAAGTGGDGGGSSGGDGGGSSGNGGSGGDGDGSSGNGGSGGDGGSTGAGGCDSDCDDDLDCTIDECVAGECVHRVDDSACGAGESCDLSGGGCTAGSACGDESDCEFPACSQNRRCDPALAACTYDALDGDGDGFAPAICGGGDCNDDDADVGPGAPEACNGADDDCDGEADDDATCPGEGQVCMNAGTEQAECACPEQTTECNTFAGVVCADTMTDAAHCGACNNSCGSAGECVDGGCTCPESGTECTVNVPGPGGGPQQLCVDTQTDAANCGDCGDSCYQGYGLGLCEGGGCVECGGEGQRCCATPGVLGTGCAEWLVCEGELGGASSECKPCGQEVGAPCCAAPVSGDPVCAGEWYGAQPGDPLCGDDGTCVAP